MQLRQVAPAFVEMAHRIVWCTAATVDAAGRPRSRILHPIWEWDGSALTGWIATGPTPVKVAHLQASPYVSCNYWAPDHDTCLAECRASWVSDPGLRRRAWDRFANAPEPVGYDPSIIPGWNSADAPEFAVLRLDPWRLRVFPGHLLLGEEGQILTWQE